MQKSSVANYDLWLWSQVLLLTQTPWQHVPSLTVSGRWGQGGGMFGLDVKMGLVESSKSVGGDVCKRPPS